MCIRDRLGVFGSWFAGLFGFRSVSVNPERSLDFKVADYQRGVRQSRQLFTREALRGGPIEPRDIVDSYINANRSLFGVRQEFKKDIDAARVLNISDEAFRTSVGRLSGIEVNTIDNGLFRPINISPDIRQAFRENAANIGEADPLASAQSVISAIQNEMRRISLDEPNFPFIENPLLPSAQETPVTPSALNLPAPDSSILSNSGTGGGFNNLSTAQKLAILFGRD